MSKAGSKGMAGMVMAIPIFVYSTEPHSHTSKGLAISMHTATLQSYAHLLVLETMGYYSLVGIQLERLGFDCKWK